MRNKYEWNVEVDKFISDNHLKMTYKEMSLILDKSAGAVASRALKVLKLKKFTPIKWSVELIKELSENYHLDAGKAFTEKYNFSLSAVQRKASSLDVHYEYKYKSYIQTDGYVVIFIDKKPILEHRYIYEQFIGRKLNSNEIIHHINSIKTDNRIENLYLMDRASHCLEHHTELLKARLIK